MIFRVHLVDDLGDLASFIYDEGRTDRAHIGFAKGGFFSPYPIRLLNILLRIGDESKGKILLFNKVPVRSLAV